MIDTTSLNEPTRNICLVYTGRLDCNESRELNDFILGVGKYEIKRVEIVEYNIVVLLIKSTSAISYNEETILFSALSDRIRSGNIYYCITYLNSGKALVSDKNERFFFTGQSLLNENGFVYYNEQDYIDELKKILEKKMNELSEKSDCMKNELNERLDLMELYDDAFGDRRSKLEDRIGFSYSNYPDISSSRDRFIVGNAGMLCKSSAQTDSGIYLHLVSPKGIENGEVLIPEGVTHIAKTAFKTLELLPYSTSQRCASLIRKIVFPSTFADDLYLDDFSSLEHLECIEVKSDKKVSLYFDESKRFKIAEFKRELKFPYNPQDDIIRKNRHENSITAQGCVLEIGNG